MSKEKLYSKKKTTKHKFILKEFTLNQKCAIFNLYIFDIQNVILK